MKILAGIVTYNPDLNRLKDNISAIKKQIDRLIIVDNGSSNFSEITSNFQELEVISLKSNKGIAVALNTIGQYAIDNEYSWFLTLDQDTVVYSDLISIYKQYLSLPNVGTLTCIFQDINKEEVILSGLPYKEVEVCITSAALMNTSVFEKSRRFDEWMFIDYVDYDINFEFQRLGYKIYQINQIGFLHEIGQARAINFLGIKTYTTNHSALRRYYMVRNTIYLYKKYGKSEIRSGYLRHIRDDFFKVFFFENHKWEKLSAMFKGLKDGLEAKVEKNV